MVNITHRSPVILVVVCAGLYAGCGPLSETPTPGNGAQPANFPSAEPAVKLDPIDRPGFDALLTFHGGKVVLVDFWGTWCLGCRETFPHTVGLSRELASRGLVTISLCCDDEAQSDAARQFLKFQDAPFQHLRSVYGSSERTFTDFEIDGGALPHYKLYDRKGQLRYTFASGGSEGPIDLKALDAAVEELLGEST